MANVGFGWGLVAVALLVLCVMAMLFIKIAPHLLWKVADRVDSSPLDAHFCQKNTFRLLTYNVFVRPFHVANPNSNGDHKDERLNELIHHLDHYDIISLQELFTCGSFRAKRFLLEAEKRGFHYYVSGPSPPIISTALVDGGLAILSRYPIVSSHFMLFSKGLYSDALASKGVLYVKVKLTEQCIVHAFSTHLQASYRLVNDPTVSIRKHQIKELVEFAQRVLDAERNGGPLVQHLVIIAGDFNTDSLNAHNLGDYKDMIQELSVLGSVEDVLFNQLGEHRPTTIPYIWHKQSFSHVSPSCFLDGKHGASITEYICKDHSATQNLSYSHRVKVDLAHPLNDSQDSLMNSNEHNTSAFFLSDLRLDYVFVITLPQEKTKWACAAHIEEFRVKYRPFIRLSDHFGLCCEFSLPNL